MDYPSTLLNENVGVCKDRIDNVSFFCRFLGAKDSSWGIRYSGHSIVALL